jgi:hypothetical protein
VVEQPTRPKNDRDNYFFHFTPFAALL